MECNQNEEKEKNFKDQVSLFKILQIFNKNNKGIYRKRDEFS